MTNHKAQGRRTVGIDDASAVELELILGLGSEDAELVLDPEARSLDLHPWLLDCVAVQVNCLGHQDEFPRAWDWENVLTLLEPGEELLYVLDHVRGDGNQTGRAFTLWLAVRFPQRQSLSAGDLDRRRKRARMIVSQFQRQAFPGSDVHWVDPSELQTLLGFSTGGEQRCVCVSGLPSPRDLEDDRRETERANATRNYQSLNDVAESLVDLRCDYRIAFVIERVDADSLKVRLGQATQLRDAIHPHVRGTIQFGGSRGTNTSTSTSQADGTSRSKQTTESSGSSDSEQEEDGWAKRAWDGVKNVFHPIRRRSTGPRTAGRTWTRSTSETDGDSKTVTVGTSSGTSEDTNWSESQERLMSKIELADRSLERTVAALHEAHGTGGYRWSAFILADGRNADLISGALVGVLAGSRTKDYPFNRFAVHGVGAELLLGNERLLNLVEEAAPILPLSRACEALLLPEAELPGVRLRRNVFLGRTFRPPEDGQPRVGLGPDAFSALTGDEYPELIEIPRRDLFRHILVAGTTGSGKTTRVVEILNNMEDDHLSVIVFETAKRTYRKRLQRAGRPAPLVYSLGSSREVPGDRFRPLRLNPFYFEIGTSLKRHIAVLSDALAELMPTEAMIAPLMRKAVEASYVERGWDIERGLPTGGRSASWPSVLDFAAHVRQVAHTLNYGPEVMANYRGALESRAALFVDATFQDIFAHDGNVPVDELFPVGHDVIVEVEDLPPSEVDIRAFVMTLLLSRLRAVQAVRDWQSRTSNSGVGARLLKAPAAASESDAGHVTTLRRAVAEHLRSLGHYAKAERKELLKSGEVWVNGVVATNGDRQLTRNDRVVVGDLQIWPKIEREAASAVEQPVTSKAPVEEHTPQVASGPRRWLVVVEEAHNVLDRSFEARRPADESNAGRTLLRCIDRLLQEGREMELGVMVIDQSPSRLARSVISNTGTKIVMRLEDGAEMEEIGRALGLQEAAWKKLGYLQEGEAIIKASFMDAPVKTARFNETTSGPGEHEPTETCTVPRYAELGDLWNGVLAGARRPDEAWLDDVLSAADGSVELAAFVGVKGLLEQHRNDAELLAKTRELRAVLATAEPSERHLLDAARETFKRSIVVASYGPLLDVARLMFRALVKPAAADPAIRVTGVGIQRAADLMALAGLGSPETWRALLLGLSGRPGLRWQDACGRFAAYCNEVGRSDATTPVRVLLLSAEAARSTMNGQSEDPVELVLHAQALLQPLIELGPQTEEPAVTQRWQVLADHSTRELTLDLASRHGEDVRAAVAALLNVEATSDA
jgi:hypothetical protein